jgi:hypothetical protein
MTGTLPSIPLQQNIDENGLPQSGCRLFLYEANTSTPIIAYKDFLMTPGAEHSWPISGDAMGRIPMFFLADGFYRARLEERDGAPIYDEPQLPALSTGDGGGVITPDPITQWVTGDFIWQPVAGARDGWVRANARTIGNAVSGASERAHADCANLFAFLWSNFTDAACPVSGGRGANGPADFNNNKQITLFDMRGMAIMGLDGMGNALRTTLSATPIHSGTGDTPGSLVGLNSQVMSVAQMPYHAHNATTSVSVSLADPGHVHAITPEVMTTNLGPNGAPGGGWGFGTAYTDLRGTGIYVSAASGATTVDPAGGNNGQNNVPYSILGTWYLRL